MISDWTLPAPFNLEPEAAAKWLQCYFFGRLTDGGGPRYTGAMFESIGRDQDAAEDRFVAGDLLAVSMLSVDVPARASIALLGHDAAAATELLAHIDSDVDLVDANPSVIAKGSAAWDLWSLLMSYEDVGPTTASKLMARKRPRLVPIQDSVVVATLNHSPHADFWASMQAALRRNLGAGLTLSAWLRRAHLAAGLGSQVSELRVFDVLVWLSGKRASPVA